MTFVSGYDSGMKNQTDTATILEQNVEALRSRGRKKKLTQDEVATLASNKGFPLSQKSVSRIYTREVSPNLETIEALAGALGVEPWELLVPGFGEGRPKKPVFTVDFVTDTGYTSSDGIAHEGKLWIVPQWIALPKERVRMPVRMIRFDDHPMIESPASGAEYLLNQVVPMSVLTGSSQEGFSVLEGGEVSFAMILEESVHL
jgi:transcriptional regulator with XRE-family HTH domain